MVPLFHSLHRLFAMDGKRIREEMSIEEMISLTAPEFLAGDQTLATGEKAAGEKAQPRETLAMVQALRREGAPQQADLFARKIPNSTDVAAPADGRGGGPAVTTPSLPKQVLASGATPEQFMNSTSILAEVAAATPQPVVLEEPQVAESLIVDPLGNIGRTRSTPTSPPRSTSLIPSEILAGRVAHRTRTTPTPTTPTSADVEPHRRRPHRGGTTSSSLHERTSSLSGRSAESKSIQPNFQNMANNHNSHAQYSSLVAPGSEPGGGYSNPHSSASSGKSGGTLSAASGGGQVDFFFDAYNFLFAFARLYHVHMIMIKFWTQIPVFFFSVDSTISRQHQFVALVLRWGF